MANPATRCGKCGRTNRAGARFCVHCGADLTTMPAVAPATLSPAPTATGPINAGERCPSCGQDITPGARFCRNCGKTLSPTAKPTTAEAVASAPPLSSVPPTPSAVAETLTQTPVSSPVNPAAPSASRFAFPVWAWTLFGFFIGLLTGVGVLWAQPELLNWTPAPPQATVEPLPSGPASKASTPSATIAPGAVITPTQAPLTATVPATGSLSTKLPLSGTMPITVTIKRITP